ncbi:MAG: GatB/YqeY domain-containing protein [Rhodospirillales bacterium]
MLRDRINDALKDAMLAKSQEVVAALRLILATLKDRDIAARAKGNLEGIGDDEILALLQSMIKQRSESIEMYEKGGRLDLAERETKEIATIEQFLPEQIADDELVDAITSVIIEEKGKTLKDMGRVMTALKERYTGRMDFAKASAVVKKQLS